MGRLRLIRPTRYNTDERGLGQTSGEGQGGGACRSQTRVGPSGHEWATGQQQQQQELTVMHRALLNALEWTTGADCKNGCMSMRDRFSLLHA